MVNAAFKTVLKALVFVCISSGIAIPVFLVTYGSIYKIGHQGQMSSSEFKKLRLIYGAFLLIGSIIGTILCEFVVNRVIALLIALLANVSAIIFLMIGINTNANFAAVCLYIFGLTVGIIGPILVLYILDHYSIADKVLSSTFIYMICCCNLLTSIHWLYRKRLYETKSVALVVAFVCLVIAFVILLVIFIFHNILENIFVIKARTKIVELFISDGRVFTRQMINLLIRTVPAAALLVFISKLENSVITWTQDKFPINQTFDSNIIWYQEDYTAPFFVPVFIIFGLESHPRIYFMTACCCILVASWLWPYVTKLCLNLAYFEQFLDEPKDTPDPLNCTINLPILKIIFPLILVARLLLVTSVLIIACRDFEAQMKFVPVGGCFIFFYLAYVINCATPFNYLIDFNGMMMSLFIILLINVGVCIYLEELAPETQSNDDTEIEEVKVIREKKTLKQTVTPIEETPKEEESAPLSDKSRKSVTAKRASRTNVAGTPRRKKLP